MKKQLILFLSLISVGALANEIQGTLMLKGSLKTNIMVNGVKTVCKFKVDKVKNLMEEDSFGNPGYSASVQVSLDGRDIERGLKVKFAKDLTVTNLHLEKNISQVKDFDYFSDAENLKVKIDEEGRIVSTSFTFQQQTIQCNF